MEYFNTFGGNPVSCAIGEEVLRVVLEENLQEHARTTGNYLKKSLIELQDRHRIIGEVRGHGIFLGIELVGDENRSPAGDEASYLANRMREMGFLMSTDGPHNNVMKIKPPMCFNRENADRLVEMLDRVLSENFLQR
jgi:4-aminobutyrate aminotransferase-like enzyme